MKLKMFSALSIASVLLPSLSFAGLCSAGMEGSEKIMVKYIQGPSWEKFGDLVGGHLGFLAAQMRAGAIQFAGPFPRNEDLDVGMIILNSDDPKQADVLIQKDPLVQQRAVTYEIKRWLECTLAK